MSSPVQQNPKLLPELDINSFRATIKALSHADFDGHTDFFQLSAEEKLMWLSQVAQFYFEHCTKKVVHGE